MILAKRLDALELKLGMTGNDPVEWIFIRFISPAGLDEQARYATHGDTQFIASEDETEDQFIERVKASIPKPPGKVEMVLLYSERHGAPVRNPSSPCIKD